MSSWMVEKEKGVFVKKLGIFIAILFALVLAAILIIPQFINVDQYRPQLIQSANERINGKLDLGKLSLSLWGQIRIEVNGLKLTDPQNREVISVKEAYFHVPLLPLITGSPILEFKMREPQLLVVKNKQGKLNVTSLMKESSSSSAQAKPLEEKKGQTSTSKKEDTTQGKEVRIPAIAARSKIGIEFDQAHLIYRDESTASSTEVKDLNLRIKDLSLSHPTQVELWANLNSKFGQSMLLKGPARLVALASPEMKDGKLSQVSLNAKLNLDALEISVPGVFQKKPGATAGANLVMVGSENEAKIEDVTLQFFNATLKGKGIISQLTQTQDVGPIVNFNFKSNEIEFKPWVELIPMLKDYQLGGSAQIDADTRGSSQKLDYHAKISLAGLTAKAPQLKAQPRFDGVIQVATDALENLFLTMKAPGNDLRIQGKVVSFSQPKANFEVRSSGLDLDQLIDFPKKQKSQKSQSPSGNQSEGSAPGSKQKAENPTDYDSLLDPLRENPTLRKMLAQMSMEIRTLKAYGVTLDQILCKLSLNNLTAGMNACSFKIFGGKIAADARSNLNSKAPTYQYDMKVSTLDLQQAIESQMELFKNTLKGKANFSMTGEGSSFNPEQALSNLKAHGQMRVDQAIFATLDINKAVKEAVNQALVRISDKVPGIRGKTLESLPNRQSTYDFISSDFKIEAGKFYSSNFQAKAKPNDGIDLKGSTTIGLKDYSLNANWQIIDTYNQTHLRDISVEQNGVNVNHVFVEGKDPVHFPITVGCKLTSPCISYTEVPEYLAKTALNNVTKALTGKAKEEARKKAESLIQQVAPPQVQDQLKNKLKGLFR